MDASAQERLRKLQDRIDAALSVTREDLAASDFSEYLAGSRSPLLEQLMRAAHSGWIAGLEAGLDEYDRRAPSVDPLEARRELRLFLLNYPDAHSLGLTVPPLAERSPWQVLPSRREDAP
jgi:hypothetical protein